LLQLPSRRDILGTVAVGAAASAAQVDVSAAQAPLSEYHKTLLMKGLMRDDFHVSSLKGTFYAVEGGTTTALCGVVMSSFTKSRMMPDQSVQTKTCELEWYTTLDGEIMDHWTNPITGKTVPVYMPPKYFVNTIITRPNGTRTSLTFGDLVDEKVLGWREDGDDVFMFNQLSSRNYMPTGKSAAPSGRKYVATELATYHARRSDLYRPGAKRVRVESYHSCTGDYRPWQQMGDYPGYQLLICNDRTMDSPDELPAEWVKQTTKMFPDLMRNPEGILDA